MTSALRERSYLRLLASRAIGAAVLWIDFTLIFESLAFQWTVDTVVIGLAMMLYGVPGVLAGPWVGAVVDRHCPWSMLRWSYVLRATAALALWLAPTLPIFLVCIALKGLANLLPGPAEQLLFRRLLNNEALVANTSRVALIDQGAKLFAPLFAAMCVACRLPGFAISASLSMTGVILLSRRPSVNYESASGAGGLNGSNGSRPVWAVFCAVLRNHPRLRRVFVVTLCQAFVLGFYDALLALFLKARGYSDGTFGNIVGCTAAGAILGSLVFKTAVQHLSPRTLLATSSILFGATVLTPAVMVYADVVIPPSTMLSLWVVNGFAYGVGSMLVMLTFQQHCPREVLGTVTSTARSTQILLMIVAPLLGGALSNITSLEFVFFCAGATAVGLGIFAAAVPVSQDKPHR
ncbi:MFS transporter [Pandoraea captiosa]|uniref:MFS transporter n=1 Tax=Pandoraea captiosa TaxID=2508302 RepID=UPI0015833141|nr:MFS transporter [Pandoraea captiosa]